MKPFIYLFLLCLIGNIACAQNYPKAKEFINHVILENNNLNIHPIKKSIVFQDSTTKFAISIMREGLKNNKKSIFYGTRNDSVTYIDSLGRRSVMTQATADKLDSKRAWRLEQIIADSLVLNENEKVYINNEINKMAHHIWSAGLISNWKLMRTDTVTKIFNNQRTLGWPEIYRRNILYIYDFGTPIFLRNDTFCFFYYGYGCDSLCGWGEFAIYKKENDKWVHWGTITSWIS